MNVILNYHFSSLKNTQDHSVFGYLDLSTKMIFLGVTLYNNN